MTQFKVFEVLNVQKLVNHNFSKILVKIEKILNKVHAMIFQIDVNLLKEMDVDHMTMILNLKKHLN